MINEISLATSLLFDDGFEIEIGIVVALGNSAVGWLPITQFWSTECGLVGLLVEGYSRG